MTCKHEWQIQPIGNPKAQFYKDVCIKCGVWKKYAIEESDLFKQIDEKVISSELASNSKRYLREILYQARKDFPYRPNHYPSTYTKALETWFERWFGALKQNQEGELLYREMTFLQDGKDIDGLNKQIKAFKILDEAKSEFPSPKLEEYTSLSQEEIKLVQLVMDATIKSYELWFLKWFGDIQFISKQEVEKT